ncbi:Uncharacterised protein [Salmonella enterica subsp. enterica]|uniref:Uncharacterized protein n=1 Tax=Salmonella enterica I TaxID=59201 RepID=A0A379W5C9_SALET|nr:Uncharacterised protein [Salmonella enterica subsp. enterica]
MTVSTEVDHNDYTGNGVTTSFPYTFRIFKKSDLVVQVVDLNENITELILDTDYTVTGAGGYTCGMLSYHLLLPMVIRFQFHVNFLLLRKQIYEIRGSSSQKCMRMLLIN